MCQLPEEQGAGVVAAATVGDGAAMERLAAPVAEPRSETGHLASGAGGGGAADEGRSAAGAAITAALAAPLYLRSTASIQGLTLTNEHAD
jgi:hypothetical protein